MKVKQATVFVLAAIIGWIAASVLTSRLISHAQEKPARPTRQWQIGEVGSANVYAIDTEGVCLYVTVSYDGRNGITAVPKSQLPRGTGCQ